MSYVNAAGQTVDVGCRVAYSGYLRSLWIGTVVSFTDLGSPRIEVEGRTVQWVRNRYAHSREYLKSNSAPIWDRRPFCHYRHKEHGYLITSAQWWALPPNNWPANDGPRNDYESDPGQLGSEWVEFTKPFIRTIVRRDSVMVIEGKKDDQ